MNRRSLKFIDLIYVTVILVIFSVAFIPIFSYNRTVARNNVVYQNLRGFLRGLQVYQSENNQKVDFGSQEDMGLPPFGADAYFEFVKHYTGDYADTWESKKDFLPCGYLDSPDGMGGILYSGSSFVFERDVTRYRGNTVILFDINCNARGTGFTTKTNNVIRSIGITLNGEIRDRSHASGDPYSTFFYR